MGVKESYFDRVIQNIKDMVEIKKEKQPICYNRSANGSYARICGSSYTTCKTW